MRLPCWGAICSLLIGWAPVFADQPAETLPGFHPENLLEAHGIDNVNLFNGDPGVVIPLGPEYIGGPSYRWQLKAYYSAKLWTMSTCDLENDTGQAAWVRGDPTLGAGWTMQVGYVETQYYLADQTTAFSWTYVSPDGGRHEVFFGTGTVAYTLDATRLRVTVSPTAAHPTGHGTVTYHFNGKCLDDNQGSSTNGTKVQIWTCNGNARSQEWTRYSDGTLRIHGKCLDVTGRSTRLGAEVEIWTCNGGSNQKWRIEQVSQNDFGPIVGVGSGNALVDPGHSSTNGTQLKMGRYRGDQTLQPWHVSFHHYHH